MANEWSKDVAEYRLYEGWNDKGKEAYLYDKNPDGTLMSKVYQTALEEVGIEPVIADTETQKHVMSVIYDYVKAGKDVTREQWQQIEEAMTAKNCDCIILGCTELSIVNRDLKLGDRYIDSLIVLAETAITACGYELNK